MPQSATNINIMTDRYSGRVKGFGFVEMAMVSAGKAAVVGLNGKKLKDRTLNVNAARPRSEGRSHGLYGGRKGG